ncbi:MAG: T9SS type A sorting domain-containing protein [Saprospiraceae bacterium]|nr:T9SS type A sorting domain-containing protein [Saprospiraceae bacterium]
MIHYFQTARIKISPFIFFSGLFLFNTQTVDSQTIWKTNATTTSWADAANWSTGAVPTANDDVIIIEGANVQITGNAVCRKIQINGSTNNQGKLTIGADGKLTADVTSTAVTGGAGVAALTLFGGMVENNGILVLSGRQNLDALRFDNPISGEVNSTYKGTGVLTCNTFSNNNGGGNSLTGASVTFAQTSGTAIFTVGGTYTFATGGTLLQGTPTAFPTSKSVFYCAKGNAIINGTGGVIISGDRRAIRVVSLLAESANLTIESGVIMQLTSTMGNGNSGMVTVEVTQADANSKLVNKGTLNFSGAKGNPIGMINGLNATNVGNFINEGTININGDFTDATVDVTLGGIFFGGGNILHGSSFINASMGIINYNTINTGTSVKPLFVATTLPKYTITNNGTINIGTNGVLTNAIKLGDSKAVFNNAGTLKIGIGNIVNTRGTGGNATFNNNTGGTLNFATASSASAVSDSITFTNAGGTLLGSGTFSNLGGNVFSGSNIISPGQANGVGMFTFNESSLTLNTTFNATVNGKTTAGTDFDRINAPNAVIDVTGLKIVATVGYAAATNDKIVLINAANIVGTPTYTLPRGWIGSVSGGQVIITATSAVGVSQVQKDLFRISPNPTSDKINIVLSDNTPSVSTTIELYDITGRQVLVQKTTSGTIELDISKLIKGAYLLKINANNKTHTEKIIRQ